MNTTMTRIVTHGLTALLAAAPIVWQPAFAEGPPNTSQQQMSVCAKQNKGKKGDDYKSGVSECLKAGSTVAAAPPTRQQKMSICSKQNKGKKGDDYKTAMSDCLKA
jgi:hypothetical protein